MHLNFTLIYMMQQEHPNEVTLHLDVEQWEFPVCFQDIVKYKNKTSTATSVVSAFFQLLDIHFCDSGNK
jgi:hypothetical protein